MAGVRIRLARCVSPLLKFAILCQILCARDHLGGPAWTMVCSHCQESLHPYDLQRLFVNNGMGGMEERIFCEPCATALRNGAIPIVPRDTRPIEPEKSTPEPAWYRLLSA